MVLYRCLFREWIVSTYNINTKYTYFHYTYTDKANNMYYIGIVLFFSNISMFAESIAGVCTFYAKGTCTKGALCPMRHVRGDRNIVCKHWLRGLCKKGDQCEFLHEYDMTKMPECYFYARFS